MLATYEDLTIPFNAKSAVQIDVSNYDYVVAQLVTPSTTINFLASNDGGAITGVSDGNATSALNFIGVQGTNLNSGSATTSIATSGLIRFAVVGRYLQLSGTAATVVKLLMMYVKIS